MFEARISDILSLCFRNISLELRIETRKRQYDIEISICTTRNYRITQVIDIPI